MSEDPPFFDDALRDAERVLTERVGSPIEIKVEVTLDRPLIGEIMRIEESAFREELRYSLWELIDRGRRDGFALITIREGRELVAFFFGYADPEYVGGFYGDTMASTSEGRGVGSLLFTLANIYAFEGGYTHFSCNCEERDEKGRRLRDWYVRAGMEYIGTDPKEGDLMRVALTSEHLTWMYKRFILDEK